MRKLFRKQILLLTVLAVFFGCTANGGSKDIVKGLIDVATKSGVAPDKAGASTVDIAAADPDGLEIPAPLKGVKERYSLEEGMPCRITLTRNSPTGWHGVLTPAGWKAV